MAPGWFLTAMMCSTHPDTVHPMCRRLQCGVCAEGYLEPLCRARGIAISRGPQVAVLGNTGTALVQDETYRLLYLGGDPLVVFDADDGKLLYKKVLPTAGTLRAGHAHGNVTVLLLQTGAGRFSVVSFPRAHVDPGGIHEVPFPPMSPAEGKRRTPAPLQYALTRARLVAVNDVQYAVLFSESRLTVATVTAEAGLRQPQELSAAELGLDTIRDLVLCCPDDTEVSGAPSCTAPTVLLAGARGSTWEVVAVSLPPAGHALRLSEALQPGPLSQCIGCAAAGLAAGAQALYVAVEQGSRLWVTAVDVTAWRAGGTARAGEAPAEVLPGGVATAMAFDAVTSVVYLAVVVLGAPSTIHKLKASSLLPYGALPLRTSDQGPEEVRALVPAPRLRRLYALTAAGPQPGVATLLLFAVRSIAPDVADVMGGTVIGVEGEGFPDEARCRFAGSPAATTRVSPRLLLCAAPPASGGAGVREGVEVMVAGEAALTTHNRVALLRIARPQVTGLRPDRGLHTTPQTVRVSGYGFMNSSFLMCRFGPNVTVPATFWSTTEVFCGQPKMSHLEPPVYVEVSLDGQVCGRSVRSVELLV